MTFVKIFYSLALLSTAAAFSTLGSIRKSSNSLSMVSERSKAVPFLMRPAKVLKIYIYIFNSMLIFYILA